ncbi:MAG: hypothetical protein IIB17_11410 [Chloroflexi bacterium]|nr:hypothetical protein [Chloroflexota bacterium]
MTNEDTRALLGSLLARKGNAPEFSLEIEGYLEDLERDDLDGAVHRQWGGLPNMTWVIDHTGRVAYKAGWTVESDIRESLEDVVRVREIKRELAESGGMTPPYYVETLSLRATKRSTARAKPADAVVSVGDGS